VVLKEEKVVLKVKMGHPENARTIITSICPDYNARTVVTHY